MASTVTITLRADDAEPILRKAAYEAAKFGALCDYITRRTYDCPQRGHGESLDDAKERWHKWFLVGKRMVEAFGVEYEPTSEGETLTVHIPMKNEKRKLVKAAGIQFVRVSGGEPDYKNPYPDYRRGIHEEACKQAAERVVRAWRNKLTVSRIAACQPGAQSVITTKAQQSPTLRRVACGIA